MHVFFSVSVQKTYACIAKYKAQKMIILQQAVSHWRAGQSLQTRAVQTHTVEPSFDWID